MADRHRAKVGVNERQMSLIICNLLDDRKVGGSGRNVAKGSYVGSRQSFGRSFGGRVATKLAVAPDLIRGV
jgi:hypothetical protein